MSVALLIGCGGERANNIVRACHDNFNKVVNIGASPIDQNQFPKATNYVIDWDRFDLNNLNNICKNMDDIGLIFFNQKGSALSPDNFTKKVDHFELLKLVKSWSDSHWTSSQLPFVLIKSLESKFTPDIKIGWMLSQYIDHKENDVERYPDYSANKFTNYLIMKAFSKKYNCFGIDPNFSSDTLNSVINDICLGKIICKGQVIDVFTIDESK